MSKLTARLNKRRWARVRRRVFERDGYRCRACGRPGRLECDHVVPLWKDDSDPYNLGNLQALCRGCHMAKTAAELAADRERRNPKAAAWGRAVQELM